MTDKIQQAYSSPFTTGARIYPPLFKDCGVNWYEPLFADPFEWIESVAESAGMTMEEVREAANGL